MLKKKQRLDRKAFQKAARSRLFVATALITARYSFKPSSASRFSVVVPKAVAKTAVQRNAIRRRLYGTLKDFVKRHPEGIEAILYVRKNSGISPSKLLLDTGELLSKIAQTSNQKQS